MVSTLLVTECLSFTCLFRILKKLSFTCLFKITIYISIAFVCLQLVLTVIIFGSNLVRFSSVVYSACGILYMALSMFVPLCR